MTEGEQWDALVADWQAKHDAVVAFPLFKAGIMQNNLLDEYQALVEVERLARRRMDEFIATYRARQS